jgi:hypothetical protein
MASVQQHGATPERMPLADRPFKLRDRRAAHGNGTAFSAVAPSSGPYWSPVDPITREWYCPQARIAGRLALQPVAQFRSSGESHQDRPGVWRVCHIPRRKCCSSLENFHMHDRHLVLLSDNSCRNFRSPMSEIGERTARRCRSVRDSRAEGTGT